MRGVQMDEEKKEQKKKQALPGTGEQYLLALLRCADWVPGPIKHLAEQYKTNMEAVKELYLCACDDVPLNDIEEIVEAQEPERLALGLHAIRMQHLRSGRGEYAEIKRVKEKATRLEKEVKELSGLVRGITEQVTSFDAMFPDAGLGEEEGIKFEIPGAPGETAPPKEAERLRRERGDEKGDQENVPESGTQNGKKEKRVLRRPEGKQKALKDTGRRPFWKKEKSVPDYVEELLEAGYDTGQIDYILSLIESGMSIKAIQKFASPKLPVDVMRRLKALEQQKEEKKEQKRGENQDGK